MDAETQPPEPCPRCGEVMSPGTVKTAIWRGDRLFIVEDIPAQVCGTCMEQFYDEETTDVLRRLTEEEFAAIPPVREIIVPVFSLEGRVRRGEFVQDDDAVADY